MKAQVAHSQIKQMIHRDRRTFTPAFKVRVVESVLANQVSIKEVKDENGHEIDPGNVQIWIDRYKLGKLSARTKRIYARTPAKKSPMLRAAEPMADSSRELSLLKMRLLEIENHLLRGGQPNSHNSLDRLLNNVIGQP